MIGNDILATIGCTWSVLFSLDMMCLCAKMAHVQYSESYKFFKEWINV